MILKVLFYLHQPSASASKEGLSHALDTLDIFVFMKCWNVTFTLFHYFLWYSLSTICQLYPVVHKLGHVNFVTLWLLVAICTYCKYISESSSSLIRWIKLYRNLLCNLPLLRKFWEFMIVKPKWSWPTNNRS